MGMITYKIPDEDSQKKIEILENILDDINMMIADVKLNMSSASYTQDSTHYEDRDLEDDVDGWYYSDDEDEF